MKNKEGQVSTLVLSIEYLVDPPAEVKVVTRDGPAAVPDLAGELQALRRQEQKLQQQLAAAQGDLHAARKEALEMQHAYDSRVGELQTTLQKQQAELQELKRASAEMERVHAAERREMQQQEVQQHNQQAAPRAVNSAAGAGPGAPLRG